jgi:hypothetical protein
MRDIDELGFGANAEDHAFHCGNIVIGNSEIGEQRNDGPFHELVK